MHAETATQTHETSETLRSDLERLRQELAAIEADRFRLAYRARTDPDAKAELEEVEGRIVVLRVEVERLELAVAGAEEHEAWARRERYRDLVRRLEAERERAETERNGLLAELAETRVPSSETMERVYRSARETYSLELALHSLGHVSRTPVWELAGRLGEHARRLDHYLGPRGTPFRLSWPWEALVAEAGELKNAEPERRAS